MDWSTWLQGVGSNIIGAAADARFRQPYEIQRLQLEALGPGGYYTEGKPMAQSPEALRGISPTVLLIGGGLLLAVFMLKD